MATSIFVLPPDLAKAATNLQAARTEFDAATSATATAAQNLYAGWQGDAQVTFRNQEEASRALYTQMSVLIEQYINALTTARNSYIETDVECAQLLQALK